MICFRPDVVPVRVGVLVMLSRRTRERLMFGDLPWFWASGRI